MLIITTLLTNRIYFYQFFVNGQGKQEGDIERILHGGYYTVAHGGFYYMEIKIVASNKKDYLDLLLLADEQ